MPLRLDLLGSLRLTDLASAKEIEVPMGKPLALLVYLAVDGRPRSRDDLGDLLWPEVPRQRARQSVRQALWMLRRTLGDDVVVGEDTIEIGPILATTDVQELDEALARDEIDRARALWRGPFLHRFALAKVPAWQHWVEDVRGLLAQRMFRALLLAAEALREGGRAGDALDYLQEAIARNGQSLAARVAYIQALLDAGDAAAARDALVQARRLAREQQQPTDDLDALDRRLSDISRRTPRAATAAERLSSELEFVGRARELADLTSLWRRAQAGHAGLAALLGPTGIGKTRLARELQDIVVASEGLVASTKGYRGEHRLPWGTVADLVRQLMSLPGSAAIGAASDALLRSLVPSRTNGNGDGGTRSALHPVAVADAVVELVEAVAFENPLALFVDDFQWIDLQSRSLLAQVIRRVRAIPCLILIGERTGDVGERAEGGAASLVTDLGGVTLTLSPLTEAEVQELLGRVVVFGQTGRATEIVRRLHRLTRGNPLFLAEVLRKLADDGFCRLEENGWVLDADRIPRRLALPDTIQGLIRERLERLSPSAAEVAAALARERRAAPARHLRRTSELDEGAFSRAVAELVQRELVFWVTPENLDFTHDQLREATAAYLAAGRARSWIARHPWRAVSVGVAAMAALALLMQVPGVLGGKGILGASAPDFPYGRGQVLFPLGDSMLSVRPPSRKGGRWRVGRYAGAAAPTPPGLADIPFGPFRMQDGGLQWFAAVTPPSRPPYVVELHAGGAPPTPIFHSRGDDWFQALSPDGSRVVVSTENLATPRYDQNLVVVDRRNGARTVLYRGFGQVAVAAWSPDGQKIAFRAAGKTDTLVIVTSSGREVERWVPSTFDHINGVRWCGNSERLLLVTAKIGKIGAGVFDVNRRTFRPLLPSMRAVWAAACVESGRGVVAEAVEDNGAADILYDDLVTDSVVVLLRSQDLPLADAPNVRWLPDRAPPVVEHVRVGSEDTTIDWGDRAKMVLRGFLTNGTIANVPAKWSSSDPSVASVDSTGTVTGNRVGEASIIGQYGGWLSDTAHVAVVGAERTDVLFRDQFHDSTLSAWDVVAVPRPVVTRVDGAAALELRGDGMYDDYMLSEKGFDLSQGGTLEAEFQLPLNRTDRQRFEMCLVRLSSPDSLPRAPWLSPQSGSFCFRYPAGELTTFRPDLAIVNSGRRQLTQSVKLPPSFHSDGWSQVALQVRPDGKTEVYLDHELVIEPWERLHMDPSYRWHIVLRGAAVDTKLFVRGLTLWRGTRW